MRLNKYIASATGMSRRAADNAISNGLVRVNGRPAVTGQQVDEKDTVVLNNKPIKASRTYTTIIINKPPGYVTSRRGQGSKTIYDLLPVKLHKLKPVGRLDKNTSGILLLTDDGELANKLTHPRYQKTKVYSVELDKELLSDDLKKIMGSGVKLSDGISKFDIEKSPGQVRQYKIIIREGRNRQIRRTFISLGYNITRLHRTNFGEHKLTSIEAGRWKILSR